MVEKFIKFRETAFWKILKNVQEVVMVVTGTLCCILFVAEVVIRYILKIDFLGYDELVLFCVIWLYFIGGSYAMYKREHISADMMALVLKGRKLQFSHLITDWLTVIINLFMSVWGVQFFQYALKKTGHTTVWKIPHLASQSALTVGYILIAFYALFYALEDTVRYFKRADEISADEAESEAEAEEVK